MTATLHLEDEDLTIAQGLVQAMEKKAGRVLVNGFPTGVEVCDSMVHGGASLLPLTAAQRRLARLQSTASFVLFAIKTCQMSSSQMH